jgi:hypothetical protein
MISMFFNLILIPGVPIDLQDDSGNTPLHYAAKYGHHDLCKVLVGKGAFAGKRNNVEQTPYDVSENHIVRQYLLPLQFQSERNSADQNDNGLQINNTGYGTRQYDTQNQQNQQYQPNQQQSPMIHPQHHVHTADNHTIYPTSAQNPSGNYQLHNLNTSDGRTQQYTAYNNNNIANSNMGVPTTDVSTGPMNLGQETNSPVYTPTSQPLCPSINSPLVPSAIQYNTSSSSLGPPPGSSSVVPPPPAVYRQTTSSSNSRMIMPDGFHTSASDPELQKKYGHVKTVIDIAPPPTFSSMGPVGGPPPQYSLYGAQQVSTAGTLPPPVYNRYVAYDPYAPPQQAEVSLPQQYIANPPRAYPPSIALNSAIPPQPPSVYPSAPIDASSTLVTASTSDIGIPNTVPYSQSPVQINGITNQPIIQPTNSNTPENSHNFGESHTESNLVNVFDQTESGFDIEVLDSNSSSVL